MPALDTCPPLLVEGDSAHFLLSEAGAPLGLIENRLFGGRARFSYLKEGSRLVLYSDGIAEAAWFNDNEEYGAARLREHVLTPHASSESILADVRHYVDGAGLQDDATVIFVRA